MARKPAQPAARRQPRRPPGQQDHRVLMRSDAYQVAARLASVRGVTVAYLLTQLVQQEAAKGG